MLEHEQRTVLLPVSFRYIWNVAVPVVVVKLLRPYKMLPDTSVSCTNRLPMKELPFSAKMFTVTVKVK